MSLLSSPLSKSHSKSLSLLFALLFLSLPVFASIDDEFQALKKDPVNYTNTGSICEEVARLQIAKTYQAPLYTVVTGIAYGDETRIIGELDVIVFDNNTHKAVRITEVKCWKDPRAGLSKAKEQRKRFLSFNQGRKITYFKSTSGKETYTPDQFAFVKDFSSLAQVGTKKFGFDEELNYDLKELMQLRQKLITCQYRGECATLD